jgi:hypothetical protein
MEQRRKGGQFDVGRRSGVALGQQRLHRREQAPELFAFGGLVPAKSIPHG